MGMHLRVAQPRVVYVEYVEWVLCNRHVQQNNGLCCLSHTLTCGVWAIYHTQGLHINPRRACARVTVVVVCVCLSVYPSVPALAASASVETSKQRYSRVSLRLFLD